MNARALPSFVVAMAGLCGLLVTERARAQRSATPSASTTAGPSAAAKATRVHLSWVRDADAAEACPDVTQVQADVAGRLGFSPFVAGDSESASIEVLVTHNKSLWQAAVVMRNADGTLRGTRHVDSAAPECHSLAAAAALSIALIIDPDSILHPRIKPAVQTPKPTTEPPPKPVVAAPSPAPRRGPRGALALGVLGALGALPEPSVGPVLRGELELRERLAVVIAAQFLPEQRAVRAGAEAWLGLSLASVGACYRVELGEHWAVSSCGSFLLGSLSLSVASPQVVKAGPTPWVAVACGLRVSVRAGAFELALGGDALAHLARHDYTVSRLEPARTESLFAEPAAGALGSLTTGVRF